MRPCLAVMMAASLAQVRIQPVRMLRNIDRCELLIATQSSLAYSESPPLLAEALEQGISLALLCRACDGSADSDAAPAVFDAAIRHLYTGSLSPRVFSDLRRRFQIQPDGFGGSDGFGRAPTQASRAPLASRTVVLVAEIDECVNARAAGMRAVAVPAMDGYVCSDLEGVADAVVDSIDELYLDDLSTPGAYWLNTMVPTAPAGGMADPESLEPLVTGATLVSGELMRRMDSDEMAGTKSSKADLDVIASHSENEQEDAMRRILDDLDAL